MVEKHFVLFGYCCAVAPPSQPEKKNTSEHEKRRILIIYYTLFVITTVIYLFMLCTLCIRAVRLKFYRLSTIFTLYNSYCNSYLILSYISTFREIISKCAWIFTYYAVVENTVQGTILLS